MILTINFGWFNMQLDVTLEELGDVLKLIAKISQELVNR